MFLHSAWRTPSVGLYDKLRDLAARRSLRDLTVGPVLTWTTDAMLAHVAKLLALPGARLVFGGQPLTGHAIPSQYGALAPTLVALPLSSVLASEAAYATVTREVFGPVQVAIEWSDGELPGVLSALERMEHHLTAAIVTADPAFGDAVLGASVNGTTYVGLRARTTGAPQNHWFGPSGDPRGAGIGTPEAIKLVWSAHREIIADTAVVPKGWTAPPPS